MKHPSTLSLILCSASICGASETNEVAVAKKQAYQLEAIVVSAPRLDVLADPLSQDEMLDDSLSLNAGQVIEQLPGISATCASIDSPEPVVRGLGWERVVTQVDFLPLYGSCPARMDPPVIYLSPESIENLTVVRGLPSVTYGAGGTGGRVMASTIANPADPALNGATANASATYDGGRDGYTARGGGKIGNGTVAAGASFNVIDLGDYESGSGQVVPAENRSFGGGATLHWTPGENNGYWINWNYHKVDQLDYPALPMDATDVTENTFTFGSRHENASGSFLALEWQGGYSASDHLMDNSQKPNRGIMEAEAESESRTFGLRVETEWNFTPDTDWNIGVDGYYLTRDALRTRYMVGPSSTFQDPIWPDASQGQAGLFAERTTELEHNSRLRMGLRVDGVFSAIGKGDEALDLPLSNIAPTVDDAYVYFYGADAADTDQNELLCSGNVLWEIPSSDDVQWFVGAGWVQRAASITERFYTFAPAPGGYLIGNPTLDPETKLEFDTGVDYFGDRLEIGAQLFGSYVWNYILETGVGNLDVNGDGTSDLIRGFVNTDAVLGGGEIEGRYRFSNHWSVPFSLAYVRGYNVSDQENLPLIPPLNGSVGVRWEWDRSIRPWAEAMLVAAAQQNMIDPNFPETEPPGWQIVNLKGGVQLPGGFNLEAGIENLFDQDYTRHLNRTVALPVGGLTSGEQIPMPGRFFFASINWAM
ncbi:TonB-dependent receptor [Pontiellaceae bacterium B1224]|nr:TonB-dependent receptor [Pontiellaceae bacterium B1224]